MPNIFLTKPPSQKYTLVICLYIIIGLIVYFNSLFNPFIWDDELLILNNTLIKGSDNFLKAFKTDIANGLVPGGNYYRPIQVISYQLDYFLWGLNPVGFHFTSIILFILNAILVFFLIDLILKDFRISLLSGLFFLVHPIYCEATAYISARADVLVGVFFVLSFICFIKYDEHKNLFWQLLLIFSFCLALLSKEIAVIFPFVLVLYEACFRKETFRSLKAIFNKFALVFLVAFLYVILRFTVLSFGPVFGLVSESVIYRILILIKALNEYLGMLFFPFNMHMLRDLTRPSFEVITIFSVVSFVILLFFIFYFFKKQRILFFFSIWFFLMLLPQSGIMPINSYISEHFIYLPAIGFFVIFSFYLFKLKEFNESVFYLVVFSVVIFYASLSISHNFDWSNEEYFFRKIISQSPRSSIARNNLAGILGRQGRYKEALQEFNFSIAIAPYKIETRQGIALAYKGLKEYDKAIKKLKEILHDAPYYSPAVLHLILGDCYYKKNDYDSAIREFKTSLKLQPGNALVTSANLRLALLYSKKHQYKFMVDKIAETLGLEPNLLRQRKPPAINDYKKLINLEDGEAVMCTKLGMLYFNYKLYDLAKIAFKKAMSISPNYADPYWHLGGILYREGKKQEGLKLWGKAYKLDPQNPIAVSWRKNSNLH